MIKQSADLENGQALGSLRAHLFVDGVFVDEVNANERQ